MTNIHTLLDDNDLDVATVVDALSTEDIIAALDEDLHAEPTAFYDGEPTVDDLRDDFEAVDMLADKRDDLTEQVDELREEVREARRPVFKDKAQRLAQMTDRWGDTEDLMEHFDAEDTEKRWSVDDIDEKIELAEDILDDADVETTTVDSGPEGDDDDSGLSAVREPQFADEDKIGQTRRGGMDLRDIRN